MTLIQCDKNANTKYVVAMIILLLLYLLDMIVRRIMFDSN